MCQKIEVQSQSQSLQFAINYRIGHQLERRLFLTMWTLLARVYIPILCGATSCKYSSVSCHKEWIKMCEIFSSVTGSKPISMLMDMWLLWSLPSCTLLRYGLLKWTVQNKMYRCCWHYLHNIFKTHWREKQTSSNIPSQGNIPALKLGTGERYKQRTTDAG